MDRRGFLSGLSAAVAGVAASLSFAPVAGGPTPDAYQQGWDDAMSTLSFQLGVAEARGETRGREDAHRALRFTGAPPMPKGWSRRLIDLKTGG